MKHLKSFIFILILTFSYSLGIKAQTITYSIVETGVTDFYNNTAIISAPETDQDFYGQDATYQGNLPSYTDNGNGTVTDNVTGLMWEKSMVEKMTFENAFIKAELSTLGGYSDWRVPTIKELYSLILFTGMVKGEKAIKLFIDTVYFDQPLGDISIGEREIDAQTWSSTEYVGKTMQDVATVFGVNFIDGRIKGYPKIKPATGLENKMYFRLVRGNTDYGKNNFVDNSDGTVTDLATGLMWQKADDDISKDWRESLAYAENLDLAGYSDWHLPNAKELQSIVDYSRSPQTTNSPAIDPIFITSPSNYPDGSSGHFPFFWTGTTHQDGINPYSSAVYIAYGEGLGKMNETIMDVHGAGCQRSDPKSGNIADYPQYFGPQGDIRYVYNYVRCVRNAEVSSAINSDSEVNEFSFYPNPAMNNISLSSSSILKKISIYNVLGNIVIEQNNDQNFLSLDVSHLNDGTYFLKAITDKDGILSGKLMILK